MIFWHHKGDLSRPPERAELTYPRPWGDYYESNCVSKGIALETFWRRWHRETGLPYPREIPRPSEVKRDFGGSRQVGSRRPKHQAEKFHQDMENK